MGHVRVALRVPSLEQLRVRYAELGTAFRQLGVDDGALGHGAFSGCDD